MFCVFSWYSPRTSNNVKISHGQEAGFGAPLHTVDERITGPSTKYLWRRATLYRGATLLGSRRKQTNKKMVRVGTGSTASPPPKKTIIAFPLEVLLLLCERRTKKMKVGTGRWVTENGSALTSDFFLGIDEGG